MNYSLKNLDTMTIERLQKINEGGFLSRYCFSKLDYDKIQNALDRLAFHHMPASDKPKVGDLVEGAYYDGTCPFKNGRIESIEGDVITVCCKPFVPFVSFTEKGKPSLSISDGPFMTYKLEEFQPVREEKAQYKIWSSQGACANGAIIIEADVKRWKIPYERKPMSYITELDEVDLSRNPRLNSKVILHKDHSRFFASFRNMTQLQRLADIMGFSFSLDEEGTKPGCRIYNLSHQIEYGPGFWKTESLPEGAKPFVTFENGSLCTCYFTRNDAEKEIVIYHPNPNSKEVYDVMPLEQQIKYVSIYGEAGPKTREF